MEITTQVPSAFFMVGDLLLKKRKRKGIKRDFPCGNQADFKTQPTLRNYQLQPDSTFPCIRLGEALFSSIHIPWQPLASHMSWSVPNINKVHPTHRASKHPRFSSGFKTHCCRASRCSFKTRSLFCILLNDLQSSKIIYLFMLYSGICPLR